MTESETSLLDSEDVLASTRADGESVYGDLTRLRMEMKLESNGWHVDHCIR